MAGQPTVFNFDVSIRGEVKWGALGTKITKENLEQRDLQSYALPVESWRVFDDYPTPLPGTSASDDLGVTTGAFGTGVPYIGAGDCKVASVTRYARIFFTLPPEYEDGQTVQIRAACGMLTTIADTSAVVDFECYLAGEDTLKIGSDLVTTAAQNINNLVAGSFEDKVFNISATTLGPGSRLDIRMTITSVDAATVTAVIPAIALVEIQADIKG